MATHAPSTPSGVLPTLIGRSPAFPIPVDRRPTSFADAVAQYRQASADGRVVQALAHGVTAEHERRIESAIDDFLSTAVTAADNLAMFPAPDMQGLADKIEAISRDGDWAEHGPLIAADVRRLAGRA